MHRRGLQALLRLVFLCPHCHKGPPITLRESIPSNLPGYRPIHGRETYITCLDCGQKFAHNYKTRQLVDFWGIHDADNIAGNKYRLIARVNYFTQRVFVLYLLTHSEYDEGAWKQ